MGPAPAPEPSPAPEEPRLTPPPWQDLVAGSTFTRLLERRIVFLRGTIEDGKADEIAAQLLHLDAESADPITLYIDSPGGDTFDPLSSPTRQEDCRLRNEDRFGMFALYDAMQLVKAPVHTVCLGIAASAGAFLLATGTGTRSAGPNARIMIHQPLGGGRGTASDISILAREFATLRERMEHILAERTGQSVARIHDDTQRDFWMSAAEARDYGLIDEVVAAG